MSYPAEGWSATTLGSICRVVSGATPKTAVTEYWGHDVPWLTPADMARDRSQVLFGGSRGLSWMGFNSCSAQIVPAGSVVVSSRAPIGYVAIAGRELATNQGCKTAVPPDHVDSKYLYWFLVHAKEDLEARASGTTFKEISAAEFARTRFAFPSLDEQRRIVDTLEDHISRLDAADAALASSVLKVRAVTASKLHQLPPEDARETLLGELALHAGYGTSTKCVVGGGGVPVVRIPNLVDGRVDLTDEKRAADTSVDLSALMLSEGDLLIVRTNGSRDLIGRSAVVQPGVEASFASYLIRYQVDTDRVDPRWVRLMLDRPVTRERLERLAASTAGQYNLSLGKLNSTSVPVPSRDEQHRLLAEFALFADGLDAMGAELQRTAARSSSLRRALLAAAFSGRLTGRSSDIDLIEEEAS